MAFDTSRQPEPERDEAPEFRGEPIDYLDWAMRIAVFGPLLVIYSYWIWTVCQNVVSGLAGF